MVAHFIYGSVATKCPCIQELRNVYSEISRINSMRCPLCGHAEGEDIAGIHY